MIRTFLEHDSARYVYERKEQYLNKRKLSHQASVELTSGYEEIDVFIKRAKGTVFNYVQAGHNSKKIDVSVYDMGQFVVETKSSDKFSYYEATVYSNLNCVSANAFAELLCELKQRERAEPQDKNIINFITSSHGMLELKRKELPEVPELDFDYYCDGTEQFHNSLMKELKTTGLTLIHGEPGTGKTTYIKMLTKIIDKRFIFLPPGMTSILSSPDFLTFLIDSCDNTVLVIEDAEDCLVSSSGRSSAISNILNITSGIMADALRIHVIATFNTEIRSLDKALLRPGRLRAQHEFKKLNKEKVSVLTKGEIEEDATIAELNNKLVEYSKEKQNIGFSLQTTI